MNNLTFTDPRPLVDFEDDGTFALCSSPQCVEDAYNGSTFVFNVSSFTRYAAQESPVCPLNITTSTTLTENLSCEGTAINILANDVVLDCNGFTVNYSSSSAGVGINATGRNNITIKNCLVGKSGSPADSDAILLSSTSNSFVLNNTAESFGAFSDGIRLDSGSGNNLTGNVGVGPSNYGIVLFGSHSNVLVNNTGSSAGSIAIIISSSSQGTIVRDTVASGSFAFYLDGASNHNITNLTAVSSSNVALTFASSSANNRVDNSVLTGPTTVNFGSGSNNNLTNSTLQATTSWIASDGSSAGNNFTNTLFNSSNGSIRIPSNFTMPSSTTVGVAKLNTSFNNSFLNSTNLSFLNTSAQITLNGLSFTNPRAKVDFEDDNTFANCNSTQCQEISYSGGSFIFNVSSFTAYSAAETNIELLMEKSIITCTAELNSGASSAVLNTCNDNGGAGSPNPNSGGSIVCDGGTAKDSASNISVCDGGFSVFNDGLEGKFQTNLTNSSGPVDSLYTYIYNHTGCTSSCSLATPASPLTLNSTVQTACNNFTSSGRMCQCLTLEITSAQNIISAKTGTPVTLMVQDSITTPAVSC